MSDEIKKDPKPEGEPEKEPKPETGTEGEFTNIVDRFSGIMGKFKIKNAEMVADHCAKGKLEDLEDVETRMREMGVHPSLVTQVVNFWADEIQQPVPRKLKDKLDKAVGLKSKTGEEETDRIYFVDPDTAIIRLATGGEKATSLSEAKELQKLIKRDLVEKRKREGEEEGSKETPFVIGESGAWTLNPKARIGFGEFAVFQMYQDSLKKGEPIDPVTELANREEASTRLKDALGIGGKGEESELSVIDKLNAMGLLRKGGEEGGLLETIKVLSELGLLKKEESGSTLSALTQLDTLGLLRKSGEGEGAASQTISRLEDQIKELTAQMQKQEMDTLKGAIGTLSKELTNLQEQIRDRGVLEGRFALMDKAMGTFDKQVTGFREDALNILAAGSSPSESRARSPEGKKQLAKGLKQAIGEERAAKALEDKLFFGGS